MVVVCTEDNVHYPHFFELDIPYVVLKKQWQKYDPTVFYKFHQVVKDFKPDYIHTWGRVQSFYALPAVILNRASLINSQITSAPPQIRKLSIGNIIDTVNFRCSDIILSNSEAGLRAYAPPAHKSKVIYNGLNLNRFSGLPPEEEVRAKYRIKTPYTVVMVASVSENKDYGLFLQVAQHVTALRKDISFVGAGWYRENDVTYKKIIRLSEENPNIIFTGKIDDVESLVSICNVGMLLSNRNVHGEGISNAIMEYMALGKPVIATDAGGTNEIVHHNENGYLITDQSVEGIATLVTDLIDNPEKCQEFGENSKKYIAENFSLNKMGREFETVYRDAVALFLNGSMV